MNSNTGSDRRIGQGFGTSEPRNSNVESTKPAAQMIAKVQTAATLNCPVTRCRPAVRGLAVSSCRSASRLNAMAVLRANTIQNRMPISSNHWKPTPVCAARLRHARAAPASANGNANSVWLNRIISNNFRTRSNILLGLSVAAIVSLLSRADLLA